MLRKCLLGLALLSEGAFAIGRIGNNVMWDPVLGFRAPIPAAFQGFGEADSGQIALRSDLVADFDFPIAVSIRVMSLTDGYPELRGQGRAQLTSYFESRPSTRYSEVLAGNCATKYFGEGEHSYVGVAFWGNDHGYVLVAPKSDLSRDGILEILRNTTLEVPCVN